jgi:hypothetical protein
LPLTATSGPAAILTAAQRRRGIAGDDGGRRHVARDDRAGAHDCLGADRTPPRTTAPEPIDAPRSTTVSSSSQSASVCNLPPVVARGVLSLMKTTPCPTKTSSSIVTPVQMNEWLWILQRAPIDTPRWISTNVPIRVSSPIRHS